MRKIAIVALAVLCVALLAGLLLRVEVLTDYVKREYILGNWGSGDGEFGLLAANDGNTYGPLCFSVGRDGQLVIPDVPNKRLNVLSRNADGTVSYSSRPIPGKKQITCIEIMEDGTIYYSEASSGTLTALSVDGTEKKIALPGGKKDDIHGVEAIYAAGKDDLWVLDSLTTESGFQRRLWLLNLSSGKPTLVLKSSSNDDNAIRVAVPSKDGIACVEMGIGAPSQRRIVSVNASGQRVREVPIRNLDEFNQVRLAGADRHENLYFYCVNEGRYARVRKTNPAGTVLYESGLNGRPLELRPIVLRVHQDGTIYILEPRKEGLYLVVESAINRRRLALRRFTS